jgi:hypothetical protein
MKRIFHIYQDPILALVAKSVIFFISATSLILLVTLLGVALSK